MTGAPGVSVLAKLCSTVERGNRKGKPCGEETRSTAGLVNIEKEWLLFEVGGLAVSELNGAAEALKRKLEAVGGVQLSIEAPGLPLLLYSCPVLAGARLCTGCQGRSLDSIPWKQNCHLWRDR